MAIVVLDHVWKSFQGTRGDDIPAVRNFTLSVEEHELVAVVGPSGSGKSTLLRLIAGLETPSRGRLHIAGRDMAGVDPAERDVALVFQNFALYPHLTVRENLTLGLSLRGIDSAESTRRVNEMADLLGLGPCLQRLPSALSGGERQRVAVGRALVRRPKVLLCDEPLSNLDAGLRLVLRRELVRLHHHLRLTTVHVTHDQTEAMTMGQRVVVMNAGTIEQVSEPLALYRRPANVFVAGFIGSPPMNLLRGRVRMTEDAGPGFMFQPDGTDVSLSLPRAVTPLVKIPSGCECVLGVRPEDLRAAPPELSQGAHGLTAHVEAVEPTGPEVWIQLRVGPLVLTARSVGPAIPRPGDCVHVTIDVRRAVFFDPADGHAIA